MIKNFIAYPEYNGIIGEIIDKYESSYTVKMPDGMILMPIFKGRDAQCKLIETGSTVKV